MYELMQITDSSYYIQSPAKIGLVRLQGNDVCLIDSGNDKDAGRKVRQILDANGWHLVVYLADCLSSRETLDKYQIGFIYDVAGYLDTLEHVKELSARCFVPAHAEVTEDIVPLADYNIAKVHEVAEQIEGICREPPLL